jgi:hypothetical protein
MERAEEVRISIDGATKSGRRPGPALVGVAVLGLVVLAGTGVAAARPAEATALAWAPVDRLPVPAGQDPAQCHSYGSAPAGQYEAAKAREHVTGLMDLLLTFRGSSDARTLYRQYLTPGVMSGRRHELTDWRTLAEFADDPATKDGYAQVRLALLAALRTSPPPIDSGAIPLRQLGVGADLTINYTPSGGDLLALTTTPALIAGGGGGPRTSPSLVSQRGAFHDTRDIDGTVRIVAHVRDGVTTRVKAQLSDVTLRVQDSIDFCPGGLGGATARELTLPMSRLERTPAMDGGGWTQPVLWSAEVPLPAATLDVTDLYRPASALAPGG